LNAFLSSAEGSLSRAEHAVTLFEAGANCAQAVRSAFAPLYGVDQGTAMRLAAAFGGRMARTGELCGAVSGALLVIGLRYGPDRPAQQARETCYQVARAFLQRFQESQGALLCRDLLGCGILTPEGRKRVHEQGWIRERCPRFVRCAVELLEELL
jgi:C_GCAxxG_C_C family probable redox protein